MGAKIISIFLLSFLGGVGFRSFFAIPLKFSWAVLGITLGFFIVENTTKSLHSFSSRRRGTPRVSGIFASPAVAVSDHAKNAEKSVQRISGILSEPPSPLRRGKGVGGLGVNIVMFITLLFFLGTIRLSYFEKNIEKDNLHNFYGQEITIEGSVLENKFTQASQRVIVKTNPPAGGGKTLLVTKIFPRYKYGDLLKVSGKIEEPKNFGNIDMKKILAKDKIYSEMVFPKIQKIGFSPESKVLNFLFGIREKFEEKLNLILPGTHASLANGMLLGNEGVLEAEVLEAFKKSGTVHILVLSGYNITIIGMAIATFFGFLPAALSIILFVLMTGAEAPAVRAAIMGIIGLLVMREGRVKEAMLALLWSAFFMVMWNPAVLSFDRGFQLSFLATLGLISLSGFFARKFKFLPKFLSIRENAASTFSAQIFVLPLLLSWGNHISFLSPLANILIVGAVPYVMAFSFLGGLGAFLFVGFGQAIASVSYILITYQMYVAKIFAIF